MIWYRHGHGLLRGTVLILSGGTEKNHDIFISTAGLQNEISTQDRLHTKLYCNTKYRGEDISKHFAYSDGNIEI